MQTFHEFLAKKAVVLPNLFRIEPFFGLAQPISAVASTAMRSAIGIAVAVILLAFLRC